MKNILPQRKSIRLKEYDYSLVGYYFITICTQDRECILSRINVGAGLVPARTELTDIGKIVKNIYLELENTFCNVKLHEYVIMPNHMHGIIEICDYGRCTFRKYCVCI